jgi:hypothetical protein
MKKKTKTRIFYALKQTNDCKQTDARWRDASHPAQATIPVGQNEADRPLLASSIFSKGIHLLACMSYNSPKQKYQTQSIQEDSKEVEREREKKKKVRVK